MSNRIVTRYASLLLAAFVIGACSRDEPTGVDLLPFDVSPRAVSVLQNETTQLSVTGIAAGDVTWESANPLKASVSATGLVTGLDSGFVAISARSKSDATLLASTTVQVIRPAGLPFTASNQTGATGAQLKYTILVPAGLTNLRVQIAGANGDADLYVRRGAPPTFALFDCRPYLGGSNETCNIANPVAGNFYIMVDAYAGFTGLTVTASSTP